METEVTLKELYERLVVLEAKFDLQVERGVGVASRFRRLIFLIIGTIFINLILNAIVIAIHHFNVL